MSEATPRLLVSVAEAADRLGEVHPATVRRLIAEGALGSVKIRSRRLVPVAELERYVDELVARGDRAAS